MTPRLRWVAAATIALATACTGKTGPAGSVQGTISGLVSNDAGPVAGATVSIDPGGFSAVTSATGTFSVAVPVGVYTVVASLPGYQSQVLELQSVAAGGQLDLSFSLAPNPGGPVTADAGPDRFQAGFGALVQLDASSSTGPAGAPLLYLWQQIDRGGPTVALDPDAARTATPTFTTLTLAELEQQGFYSVRRSLGTLTFSELDVERATYEFEVNVTDGVTSFSDRVVIRSVVSQVGFPLVALDTLVMLGAADRPSYDWTCQVQEPGGLVPCAPGALTEAATRTPAFRPNTSGLYVLQTPGEAPLELRAATYVGARPVTGRTTCSTCHPERHTAWSATPHATYLQRALAGELKGPAGETVEYLAECLRCHTTGYNPDAANGGFAQVARQFGWAFPVGYDVMAERLQSLAGVGCENCHGPGSLHAEAPSKVTIGKSFAAIDCLQCHAKEPYEFQGLQWSNSRHSRFVSGFRPESGDPALRGFCASCHSSPGFVAWTDSGVNTAPPAAADVTEPQTCTACHDQHGEAKGPDGQPTPRQLRIYGDVTTLVPGLGARGVGPAALCMTCHNSRTGVAAATRATALVPATQAAPHAPSQADVLLAKNAATLGGPSYPSSVHTGVPKLCVGCHMAPTPAPGSPGRHKVGGHSFAMSGLDGATTVTNVAACTGCHGGLTSFNRTAYGDYDGDGFLSGIQTEVTGLAALVQEQLSLRAAALWPAETGGGVPAVVSFNGGIRVMKDYVAGPSPAECNPAVPSEWPATCFAFPPTTVPPTPGTGLPQNSTSETDFLQAAWNYFLIEGDRSRGVHNTAFTVSVLQRTYQALAGVPVPNATLR